MTITEQNVLIAESIGAIKEEWYPPNKDNKTTGIHIAFPQNSWYPDNKRFHADCLLRFHLDFNWQLEVLKYLCKKNKASSFSISPGYCRISSDSDDLPTRYYADKTEDAIFGCLVQFCKHLKEKENVEMAERQAS